MAIPQGQTPQQYYDQQITTLCTIRDYFLVYYSDWASLPAGVKTVVKGKVSAAFAGVKTALDDVNTAIQAL